MNIGQKILGQHIFRAIMRRTVYGQFVAGEDKQSIQKTIQSLGLAKVRPLILIPMEEDEGGGKPGEVQYNKNLEIIQNCLQMIKTLKAPSPMVHFKLTALMSPELVVLLTKLCQSQTTTFNVENIAEHLENGKELQHDSLTRAQSSHLQNSLCRLKTIGELSTSLQTCVLLDAEYVKMNAGQGLITLALMTLFNQKKPLIWNTYQCYLKATYNKIFEDLQTVNNLNAQFGAKIVRGAYMDSERKYAKLGGYPDPVNDTLEDTAVTYHRVVTTMFDKILTTSQKTNIIIATHNETSILKLVEGLSQNGFNKNDERICFGQIYGMSDQISCALGQAGYIVYKSIPLGPVSEVLPYLSRRAAENSSLFQGVRKERLLYWNELKRRISLKSQRRITLDEKIRS